MKSENCKVILVEPYFELNTPNVIARETGGEVVIMPSSVEGAKGVVGYFELLDHDLAHLSKAFQSEPWRRGCGRHGNGGIKEQGIRHLSTDPAATGSRPSDRGERVA
jgi:hypothetical protein